MLKVSPKRIRPRATLRRRELGVTLVESAASFTLLAFLSGLLIDVAIGLQRYGELTEAVTQSTRIAASAPCSNVSPSSRRDAHGDFAMRLRTETARVINSPIALQSIEILDSGFSCDREQFSPPLEEHFHPVISSRVKVRFPCVFCFLVGGLDLTISARVPVEDSSLTCGYPVSC